MDAKVFNIVESVLSIEKTFSFGFHEWYVICLLCRSLEERERLRADDDDQFKFTIMFTVILVEILFTSNKFTISVFGRQFY